jgi:hypothetical protein
MTKRLTDGQLEDLFAKGARFDPLRNAVVLAGAKVPLSPSSVARFRSIQANAEASVIKANVRRNSMRAV